MFVLYKRGKMKKHLIVFALLIYVFVGGFLLFPLCHTSIQKTIMKLFVTVIVIILNFFISKFFAFKKFKK